MEPGQTQPPPPGVEALFDTVADDYDQSGVAFFGPMAGRLVTLVDPRPGEHALDIGCGRGAVTALLARAVQPSGSVTAIDVSARMVEHVRAALPEVDARRMDASAPDLPAHMFDVVTAAAVLFFLGDPGAAVRRWLDLLGPDGRLGLTTFGPVDPVWQEVDRTIEQFRPPGVPDPRVVQEQGPFANDERFRAMLADAGAVDVESSTEPLEVRLDSADRWIRFSLSTGQRRAWATVPDHERQRVVDRITGLLESARHPDGRIRLTQQVRYTVVRGHRPGPKTG